MAFPFTSQVTSFISLDRWKLTTSSKTLTLPLMPCIHLDFHREGGMFRLVIVHHNHIPACEGQLGSKSDLGLGQKKMKGRHRETGCLINVSNSLNPILQKLNWLNKVRKGRVFTWGNLSSIPSLWGSWPGNTLVCRLCLQSSFCLCWRETAGAGDSCPSWAAYKIVAELGFSNCLIMQCRLETLNSNKWLLLKTCWWICPSYSCRTMRGGTREGSVAS